MGEVKEVASLLWALDNVLMAVIGAFLLPVASLEAKRRRACLVLPGPVEEKAQQALKIRVKIKVVFFIPLV